jgi:hypothetical protein
VARRSSLTAGLIAGCTAAAAVTWLLGTASGRRRLAGVLGRAEDPPLEPATFIELPDPAAAVRLAPVPGGVPAAAAAPTEV